MGGGYFNPLTGFMNKADALGTLIEKLLSPDINLSPNPVLNGDGSVKRLGKGPDRPLNPLADRLAVVAALESP